MKVRSKKRPSSDRRQARRAPNFESGLLAEPVLAFGGQHQHVDPKTGLGLYGPYTPHGQTRPPHSAIVVGIVGPPAMISDAEQWLAACKSVLRNSGDEPFLRPHFPGFNGSLPFQCELTYGATWQESFKESALQTALSVTNYYDRIRQVVSLYIRALEVLAQRDHRPDVVICCIPQAVVDECTVRRGQGGELRRVKISKAEKGAVERARAGQLFLFEELDPTLGIEEMESAHQNLRRGFKAEAMQFGIPTQLAWPRALRPFDSDDRIGGASAQDVATRAWNFTTALYHKAGGSPWRLAEVDPDVCYVGISFYREVHESSPHLRTSMAQAFTSAGDGYVLRGNTFEWNEAEQGRSPHLDEKGAAALMRGVLDLYSRQNRGKLPGRVVVHKTSRYWEEELLGFQEACRTVPQTDFIALGWRGIQFYRSAGDYPPLRGTYAKFSEKNLLLYTVGYIPYLRTYPGARVPQPIEVIEYHGDSPWHLILEEILALTKMNWNTTAFACSLPITIAFSRKVGHILAELPSRLPLRPEYRFYM